MTKKQLLNIIKPFSSKVFAQEINPIIARSRGITMDCAKSLSYLQSNEVFEFMDDMGFSKEILKGRSINFEGQSIKKKELRAKIITMSNPEFQRVLGDIVSDNRNKPFEEIKFCQYLRRKEVVAFLLRIGETLPMYERRVG